MSFFKPSIPYLASMKPQTLIGIRELSANEHDLFRLHVNTITTDYRDSQLFLTAFMNYDEYRKVDDDFAKQCSERVGAAPSFFGGESIVLNINRLIMNLLTAVRTALDHTEGNLKGRHGPESEQFQTFQNATRRAYEVSFAYRFCYKLRNYVQHCGMPIGHISLTAQRANSAELSRRSVQSLEIAFSRDELVLANFHWGNPVRAELERLP